MQYVVENELSEYNLPVSVASLRSYLKQPASMTEEANELTRAIWTATTTFEDLTNRPVVTRSFTQYLERWQNPVLLMRGNMLEVETVQYYNEDGDLTPYEDFDTTKTQVYFPEWQSLPYLYEDVAYPIEITYTCGFETVPFDVETAILALAAHLYQNREAFAEVELKEVPLSFARIVSKYVYS